jgi:two-component system, NtrC family, nitrogen regulation response regulator GlnG
MKSDGTSSIPGPPVPGDGEPIEESQNALSDDIAHSIDSLVEYLVDNGVKGIHPLIMGEVEKRLIIKVLDRSRGNKLRAAELLGMSRNTFHRKVRKLVDFESFLRRDRDD